ncbi:MAG: double zinc ribbon domain-containing protein, partial [Paracoccaceae bacterium]
MVEKLHIPFSGVDAAGYSAQQARRKAPVWLRRLVQVGAGFVYPSACPACRVAVAEFGGVCPACWRETAFITPPACGSCGAPLEAGLEAGSPEAALCDSCAHAPPAWSRGVAAVVYDGAGRRLILGLKHADRLDIAPMAAAWMLGGQGGAGARLAA